MWQAHEHGKGGHGEASGLLAKVIPALSVLTMIMTVPQVWSVWVEKNTSGVSLLSWGAYFVSALLWLFYGLQKRDRTIWVACIGWVVLDGAVVVGVIWRG